MFYICDIFTSYSQFFHTFHFSTTPTWGSHMIIPFHRRELFGSRKGPDGPGARTQALLARAGQCAPHRGGWDYCTNWNEGRKGWEEL